MDPQKNREGAPRARDWAWAWLWIGGAVILAALLLWLNFGPRAT